MKQLPPSVQKTVDESVPYALKYTGLLNSFLSVLAFSFGLACVSTESPRLFGSMSLIFVALVWNSTTSQYHKWLDILNVAKHPLMDPVPVLRRTIPLLYGWIFLGLVAVGGINTHGWAW